MEVSDAKVSTLSTDIFYASLKNFIDYNKPDPIAQRQLESWEISWSGGDGIRKDVAADEHIDDIDNWTKAARWRPKHCIEGILEIRGDFVAVTLEMECIWADGDTAKKDNNVEDGRLSFTCRLKSGKLIEKKENEEKTERKIRKKMISRLRQDSFISQIL